MISVFECRGFMLKSLLKVITFISNLVSSSVVKRNFDVLLFSNSNNSAPYIGHWPYKVAIDSERNITTALFGLANLFNNRYMGILNSLSYNIPNTGKKYVNLKFKCVHVQ